MTTADTFYVASVNWSGVAGPFTKAEAEVYADAKNGFLLESVSVDPDIRAKLDEMKLAKEERTL